MKYTTFLLFCLFTFKLFADGGDDPKRMNIDTYEPNLNLQFIGIKDTIHFTDKKKDQSAFVISNVAIYDITKNQTHFIFTDTIKRHIVGFYFESSYLAEFKTVEFNNAYNPSDTYYDGLFEHANNRNVQSRPLSENLIIVTEDIWTKNLTFWICDKYGNSLKKEMEINKDWDWEIDVKNRSIRFISQVNQRVEIKSVKY